MAHRVNCANGVGWVAGHQLHSLLSACLLPAVTLRTAFKLCVQNCRTFPTMNNQAAGTWMDGAA